MIPKKVVSDIHLRQLVNEASNTIYSNGYEVGRLAYLLPKETLERHPVLSRIAHSYSTYIPNQYDGHLTDTQFELFNNDGVGADWPFEVAQALAYLPVSFKVYYSGLLEALDAFGNVLESYWPE